MTVTTFGTTDGSTAAGVRHRDTGWLSAVGADGPDLMAQAQGAYARAVEVLAEGGFATEQVVRVVEYVAEPYDLRAVREAALGAGGRAVNTVVVPGFPIAGRLVEIELVASLDAVDTGVAGVGEADGTVWLSSITAPGAFDVVGQANAVFGAADALLRTVALKGSAVVMTTDHTTEATLAQYRWTGRPRKTTLGPVWPGSAGILQDRFARPDALLQLDAIASRHELRGIDNGWERYAKLTYLPAVEAGPLLFMSGQAALDPVTEKALFPGDVVAQAAYTYANIVTVLKAAGLGPEDLVQTVEWVTPAGLKRYAEVEQVRRDVLGDHAVATTRVVCAKLLRPEFEIEVVPLAARR